MMSLDNAECALEGSEASCQCIVGFEENDNDECVAGRCVTTISLSNESLLM